MKFLFGEKMPISREHKGKEAEDLNYEVEQDLKAVRKTHLTSDWFGL